jgi:hypothetical protein
MGTRELFHVPMPQRKKLGDMYDFSRGQMEKRLEAGGWRLEVGQQKRKLEVGQRFSFHWIVWSVHCRQQVCFRTSSLQPNASSLAPSDPRMTQMGAVERGD